MQSLQLMITPAWCWVLLKTSVPTADRSGTPLAAHTAAENELHSSAAHCLVAASTFSCQLQLCQWFQLPDLSWSSTSCTATEQIFPTMYHFTESLAFLASELNDLSSTPGSLINFPSFCKSGPLLFFSPLMKIVGFLHLKASEEKKEVKGKRGVLFFPLYVVVCFFFTENSQWKKAICLIR